MQRVGPRGQDRRLRDGPGHLQVRFKHTSDDEGFRGSRLWSWLEVDPEAKEVLGPKKKIKTNINFRTQVCKSENTFRGKNELEYSVKCSETHFPCPAVYAKACPDGLDQEEQRRRRPQFVQPAREMFSVQSDVLSLEMSFCFFLSISAEPPGHLIIRRSRF